MSQVSTPQSKQFTAGDIERLDARGQRYELIYGELLPMSPTNENHGRETMDIAGEIWLFVRTHNLGVTYAAETGFRLSRNPDTVLAPDVAFVRGVRSVNLSHDGFVECAPDLVVETRSPNDSKCEVAEKLQRWLDFGVSLVLDLDPKRRTLVVHRRGHEPETFGPNDSLPGYDVLPGFTIPMSRVLR